MFDSLHIYLSKKNIKSEGNKEGEEMEAGVSSDVVYLLVKHCLDHCNHLRALRTNPVLPVAHRGSLKCTFQHRLKNTALLKRITPRVKIIITQ